MLKRSISEARGAAGRGCASRDASEEMRKHAWPGGGAGFGSPPGVRGSFGGAHPGPRHECLRRRTEPFGGAGFGQNVP